MQQLSFFPPLLLSRSVHSLFSVPLLDANKSKCLCKPGLQKFVCLWKLKHSFMLIEVCHSAIAERQGGHKVKKKNTAGNNP